MSNYVQTTLFTPKDTLPTTNPAKTIFGAAYDVEFGNIATAIASKPDALTGANFPSLNVTQTTATGSPAAFFTTNQNTLSTATFDSTTGGVFTQYTNSGVGIGAIGDSAKINGGTLGQFTVSANTVLVLSTGTLFSATPRLTINATGNATLAAPTAGVALTLTGLAGSSALIVNTTGVQLGAPTGGDKGAGTLNAATQLYVNNVPMYQTGTFTGTLTGMSSGGTATVTYTIVGNVCTLNFTNLSGISNTTAMTMTGLPAVCQPATMRSVVFCDTLDNSANVAGLADVQVASGTITFYRQVLATGTFSTTGFTASGSKGPGAAAISYSLV